MNLPNKLREIFLPLTALLGGVLAVPVANAAQVTVSGISYDIVIYDPSPTAPLSEILVTLEQQPWWNNEPLARTFAIEPASNGQIVSEKNRLSFSPSEITRVSLLFAFENSLGGDPPRFRIGSRFTKDGAEVTGVANETRDVQYAIVRPGSTVSAYTFGTLAGLVNNAGSVDGTGSAARFTDLHGIAADNAGNVYVADGQSHTIRKITSGGVVTTLAGSAGLVGSADGTGSAARFDNPFGLAVDSAGNVYVGDIYNHTIRKITSEGAVTTVAGLAGNIGSADGAGSTARFKYPRGLAVDGAGNLYVADFDNNTIRKITSGGLVTTVAGSPGNAGSLDGVGSAARFSGPSGVAVDNAGNLYVADQFNHTIRKITSGGAVTTLAGGARAIGLADGPGTAARFYSPHAIAVDSAGNVYVADTQNYTIRKMTSTGFVTTIGGLPRIAGSTDGVGGVARFNDRMFGIAVNSVGTVYVADGTNKTVRWGTFSNGPPVIVIHPAGGTFKNGQSLVLGVTAVGTGTLSYAWFKDGRAIPGATSPVYQVNRLALGDTAGYHVEVRGGGGTTASLSSPVVVQSPPQFAVQPADAFVESGLTTSFNAVAFGRPAPRLQWFSRVGAGPWEPVPDRAPFSGTNGTVLAVNGVSLSQEGLQFRATATSSEGAVDSAVAVLRVSRPSQTLRILRHPVSAVVPVGRTAVLQVQMEGNGPFSYQWRKEGATMVGYTVSGTSFPAQGENTGSYSVIVKDAAGASVTSNIISLTVAGAVDSVFDPRGGPDGEVSKVLALNDGSLLLAGSFTRVSGVPRSGLARMLGDGTVDLDFNPGIGPNGPVQALVELASGKALIVGQFDRYDGVEVSGVVRIDRQGKRDPAFVAVLPLPPIGPDRDIPPHERFHFSAISLPGGGYLLGGRVGLTALSTSGAFQPQSVNFSNGGVFALVGQFDGGILAGGDFTLLGGNSRNRIARLTADFRADLTFNVGGGPNGPISALKRSPEGSIYVVGKFSSFDGLAIPSGIARISPRGALDRTYNPPLAAVLPARELIAMASEGRVRPLAGRLEAIRAAQVTANGSLAVSTGTTNAQAVSVINPRGAVSAEVNVPVQGVVNSLAETKEGALGVVGSFPTVGGVARSNVALVSDGGTGSRLFNLSCRARITGSANPLILGFVISGPDAMRVLVRGVGPTLQAFRISDFLARPQLIIYDGRGREIFRNTGWRSAGDADSLALAMQQVGAFALNSPDDTALVLNLAPGSYTAHISGVSGTQGVALGEIYAADQGRSQLVNSSVRGSVGVGENVLIPGFSVTGGSRLVLVRAVGPGLAQFGVPGTLSRPSMDLRSDGGTLLASNQGWTSSYDPAALQQRTSIVGAFPLDPRSADAAVLVALDRGGYSVVTSGVNGTTGEALIEVYDANGVERPALTQ